MASAYNHSVITGSKYYKTPGKAISSNEIRLKVNDEPPSGDNSNNGFFTFFEKMLCYLRGGQYISQADIDNGDAFGANGHIGETGCDMTGASTTPGGNYPTILPDFGPIYGIPNITITDLGANGAYGAGYGNNYLWVSTYIPASGNCLPSTGQGFNPDVPMEGDCIYGHWQYYQEELPVTLSDQEPQENDYYTDPETNTTYRFGDIEDFFENNPDIVYNLNEENFDQVNYPGNPILTGVMLGHAVGMEAATLRVLNPTWGEAHIWAVATWDVLHNGVHLGLDVIGLVPAFGTVASLVNGGIYYIEGDKINCALSAAAAIPFESWALIGGKWVSIGKSLVTVPITEKAVKYGIKAIIVGKDIRFVKVAVEAFDYAALKAATYIKPASATLTNLSRTLIDKYAVRIAPTETSVKNLVDDIVHLGDVSGIKTEQLADAVLQHEGYVKYDAKFGSNNGFDGVYIKGDPANPTDIIVNEAKQMNSAGSIKLNPGNPNTLLKPQMSDDWIDQTINSMVNNSNTATKQLGNALDANKNLITKTVTAVDKSSGEIVILKLGKY